MPVKEKVTNDKKNESEKISLKVKASDKKSKH